MIIFWVRGWMRYQKRAVVVLVPCFGRQAERSGWTHIYRSWLKRFTHLRGVIEVVIEHVQAYRSSFLDAAVLQSKADVIMKGAAQYARTVYIFYTYCAVHVPLVIFQTVQQA